MQNIAEGGKDERGNEGGDAAVEVVTACVALMVTHTGSGAGDGGSGVATRRWHHVTIICVHHFLCRRIQLRDLGSSLK